MSARKPRPPTSPRSTADAADSPAPARGRPNPTQDASEAAVAAIEDQQQQQENSSSSAFRVPAPPSSTAAESSTSHPQSRPKIAIPRIKKDRNTAGDPASARGGAANRVEHACEPCRSRKSKCSGEKPVCKHCEKHSTECYYADGKRLRAKKEIGGMIEKLDECDKLFRQILPQLDRDSQLSVQALLAKAPSPGDVSSPQYSPAISRTKSGLEASTPPDGENVTSARVGSVGSLDHVSEDFDRDDKARATGFYNKQSEIAWLQRVEYQLNHGSSTSESTRHQRAYADTAGTNYSPRHDGEAEGRAWGTTADVAYHLDDLDTSVLQEVDESALPTRETADALLRTYLATVHPSFPFFLKDVFISQYQTYFRTFDQRFSRFWLAMLNLVFAIGASHSHLVGAEWRGDDRDHLVYLARARLLALNDQTFVNTRPNYELVQVLGLFTLYLTASSQVSRAWIMAGTSIRIAETLGMHLLNTSKDVTDTQKEASVRLWWSIFTLERLLCIMTGRPSAVAHYDIKTSLPLDIEEEDFPRDGQKLYTTDRSAFDILRRDRLLRDSRESSTNATSRAQSSSSSSMSHQHPSASTSRSRSDDRESSSHAFSTPKTPSMSLYFLYRVDLAITTHTILERLFSPHALDQSWAETQRTINVFEKELKKWHAALPTQFDFAKSQRDQKYYRQRLALGFMYYSSQIILCRPCVCRLERRIANESAKSKEFNRETAATCVQAARNLVGLLPDEPNCHGLYSVAPWWCVLHHIMQAGSILMLEMSFRVTHVPGQADELLKDAKKVVRWLRAMAEDSLAARRAWRKMVGLLKGTADRIGGDISEISDQEPPQSQQAPPSQPEPSQAQPQQQQYSSGNQHSHPHFTSTQVSMDSALAFSNSPTTMDPDSIFQLTQAMYPPTMSAYDDGFGQSQWDAYDEYSPYMQNPEVQHQQNSMFNPSMSEMQQALQQHHHQQQQQQQQAQQQHQHRRRLEERQRQQQQQGRGRGQGSSRGQDGTEDMDLY